MDKQILIVKDAAIQEYCTTLIRYIKQFDPQVVYFGHPKHQSLVYLLSLSSQSFYIPLFGGYNDILSDIKSINLAYQKMQFDETFHRILVITDSIGFLACNISPENARQSTLLKIYLTGPEAYKVKEVSFFVPFDESQVIQVSNSLIM